jgi:hypothetical protein
VRNIEERYNILKAEQKRRLSDKMNNEREKYAISYEKHLQDLKQEEEMQEAKTFKKYEGYVSIMNLSNFISPKIIIIVFYNERKTSQIKDQKKIRK